MRMPPRTSSRSSPRVSCTGSIPRPTCSTSSTCSRTGRAAATSNWHPSTGPPPARESPTRKSRSRSATLPCRRRRPRKSSRLRADRTSTNASLRHDGQPVENGVRAARTRAAPRRRDVAGAARREKNSCGDASRRRGGAEGVAGRSRLAATTPGARDDVEAIGTKAEMLCARPSVVGSLPSRNRYGEHRTAKNAPS